MMSIDSRRQSREPVQRSPLPSNSAHREQEREIKPAATATRRGPEAAAPVQRGHSGQPTENTLALEFPSADEDSLRARIVQQATSRIGSTDERDGGTLVIGVLRAAGVTPSLSNGGGSTTKRLHRVLKKQAAISERRKPKPGDVVFFHNTYDRNHDGYNNDWFTLMGIVEAIDRQGTVTFVAYVSRQVRRLRLNTRHGSQRHDPSTQQVLNDFLRAKKVSDPEYTQHLAGELFAGYGDSSKLAP